MIVIAHAQQQGGLCQADCGREYDRILCTRNGPPTIGARQVLEKQHENREARGVPHPARDTGVHISRMMLCRACLVALACQVFSDEVSG